LKFLSELHIAALLTLRAWVAPPLLAHHVLLRLAVMVEVGRWVLVLVRPGRVRGRSAGGVARPATIATGLRGSVGG